MFKLSQKIISLLIIIILLFCVGTADAIIAELRKAGTNNTEFSVSVGEEFGVDIYINTMGSLIGGVYIYLSFDDKIFELVDSAQPVDDETAPFLDNWQLMENDTHGDPGNSIPQFQIDYAKATFAPENAKVGDGVIGTIRLRALKPVVSTQITFDASTFHDRETQCARGAALKVVEFTKLTPATISVVGALNTKPIDDIEINVGESYELHLDEYVDDPVVPDSSISWKVSGNENIETAIDSDSHVVTFSSQDWTGEESMVFTAEAESGKSAVIDATVKVISSPVFSELPEVKFKANEQSQRIDLKSYLSDFDDPELEGIEWDYKNANNIEVELDSGGFVTFRTHDGWTDTKNITIVATDSDGNVAEAPIKVTVIAGPTVDIPDNIVSTSDGTISKPLLNLDDCVSDPDNTPDEVTWSFSGNNNIDVIIDEATHEVTFKSEGWTGTEEISFTATDLDSQSGSDTSTIRLIPGDSELFVMDIPDISFSEGEEAPTLDLNKYVIDLSGSIDAIIWTYEGNDKITVRINQNNVATFSADEMTEEVITFTATDSDDNQASDEMTASYVANLPPKIADLPEQTLQGGAPSKIFNLDDFVSDDNTPKDKIDWSTSGYNEEHLIVSIDQDRNVLVIPAKNWYGTETVTFTASDAQGNEHSKECQIKITAVPVVTLPDEPISVTEGETNTSLDLDEYVEDLDTPKEQISWETTESPPLTITVDSALRKIVIYAPTGSEGDYVVTCTATDADGNKDEDTVTVKVTKSGEEKSLIVKDIPDVTLSAQEPSKVIKLNDYIETDFALDEINWAVEGNTEINIDINSDTNEATLAFQEDFAGEENITFIATTTNDNSDSDDVTVTMQMSSQPPSLIDLPEVVDGKWKTEDGELGSELNLDDYVEDEDTPLDELKWEVDYNQEHVDVKISPQNLVTVTAVQDWHGKEELTFTVTDSDGSQDSITTSAKFLIVAPKIYLPENLSIYEEKKYTLKLDNYVTDEDTSLDKLSWDWESSDEKIKVEIDAESPHKTTITADEGSVGEHEISFVVTDPDGNSGEGTVVVSVEDKAAPAFTVTVLPNPIQPTYITVNVCSSEKLSSSPVMTVDILDKPEVALTEIGTNIWRGKFIAPFGTAGVITVTGTDLAGNEGNGMKSFSVSPKTLESLSYLKLKSYPNPVKEKDEVTIRCEVDSVASIQVKIYDIEGKLVKVIEDDQFELDNNGYKYNWNMKNEAGTKIPCGIYFCHAEAMDGDFRITSIWKIAVIK